MVNGGRIEDIADGFCGEMSLWKVPFHVNRRVISKMFQR